MRRLLFLMPILLCAAVSAHAQSLDAFKQRLAEPTPGATLFNRAQVTVTEHDDAARAVADAARAGQRLYFEGFHRVCVFSDNGPAARDGAFAAKLQCDGREIFGRSLHHDLADGDAAGEENGVEALR